MAGNDTECEVMIDQGRAIDNHRLRKRLGAVPRPVLGEIKRKVRLLLDL
jgi:mRNA-degrading endonuclease toxin of MazEF toxin-antitoxin module